MCIATDEIGGKKPPRTSNPERVEFDKNATYQTGVYCLTVNVKNRKLLFKAEAFIVQALQQAGTVLRI